MERSARGGASGEITIRESLVFHLASQLNVQCDVAKSDAEFEVLDPTNGSLRWVVDFSLKRLPDPSPEVTT